MRPYLIFFLGIMTTLISCTKKDQTRFEDASGVQFQYGSPKSPDILAAYKEFQIPRAMVFAQSAPLQEMATIENDFLFSKAVEQSLETLKESKTVSLKFYLPLSDKIEVVFEKMKLDHPKSLTVTLEKTGSPSVAATINDRPISKTDLAPMSIKLAALKHRELQEIINRVRGIVIRSQLAKLAEDSKVSLEDYLKTHVYSEQSAPTAQETEAFAKESNLSPQDLNPEVKKKVFMIIEERKRNSQVEKYFAQKVQKEPIMIYFSPERMELSSSQSLDSVWGYKDAPIHIQVFSDLNCTPCLEFLKSIEGVEDEYRGQVRVSFNHFIFEQDRSARLMAEAAQCAFNQSKKGFRSFIEKLADENVPAEEDSIYTMAGKVGLKVDLLKECLTGQKQTNTVNDQIRFAKTSGIRAMPTIIIGGDVIEGPISKKALNQLVKDQVVIRGDSFFTVMVRRIKGLFEN